MSKIKRFIEEAAAKLGMDDVIYTIRTDGRVEIICEHGVGHPSKELTLLHCGKWNDYDEIHGCCGCCFNNKLIS